MPNKRMRKSVSASVIPELVFNRDGNSFKVSETGFSVETFLGTLNTAKECGKNKPVMIANSAGTVAYVKFGDSAVVAPTGLADGVMVPPNSLIVLASGSNTHVIASAVTVGGYVGSEQILEDASNQPSV